MRTYTEAGRIKCFIGRSIDTTTRNLCSNPQDNPETNKKMKLIAKKRLAVPENNPMFGKKHSLSSKLKMRLSSWKPETPHYTFYGQQARKIVSKHLGRVLLSTEIVHHLDGNRKNNVLDNLFLFPSSSKHTKYHCFLRSAVREILEAQNGT